ncbi:uncharacterized protein HaLaN_15080 [Haematococcus lacustris]|uniref:Uncharacterized protein n=1 Tax=Haematococcus lacustris TaxID=44745 RepID=A0A699Z9L6_HAELA|nr:uncharacterized protein HaLaN_15080 [Haematococcus lacustris]
MKADTLGANQGPLSSLAVWLSLPLTHLGFAPACLPQNQAPVCLPAYWPEERKEAALREWQQQSSQARKLREAEAKARAEHIAMQARQAAEKDRAKRHAYEARVQEKAARVEEIMEQRDRLARQMQVLRRSLQQQTHALHRSLELMRRSGAAFVLPPDVSRSLDAADPATRPASFTTPPSKGAAAAGVQRAGSVSKRGPAGLSPEGLQAPLSSREGELRETIKREIAKEAERQVILDGTSSARELNRLNRIFNMEREEAKRHIMALTAAAQATAVPCSPTSK